MPEMGARERMISAAVTLFARSGFNGVTTRDIARHANVSEGNIFRYFPSKRDLFIAAIDFELVKLNSRVSSFTKQNHSDDPQCALRALFGMISETVIAQPELIRLTCFSLLELGAGTEPTKRDYLCSVISAISSNFQFWSRNNLIPRTFSPGVTVFSFISTIVLLQTYSSSTGQKPPRPSLEDSAAECVELWCRVLSLPQPLHCSDPIGDHVND
jgi:AcrR family transcriptional regulator